ncbi:glucosamine--fructose-6-phosphate aminotransferase [Streptomyces sp. NPDC049881]|uniref:glucosamine--fructose-6-phosphate aminotransferase n=1 Tax=Streptomyces sp. NPDC049881 TaxID=3155778 RepID=UPI0034294D56
MRGCVGYLGFRSALDVLLGGLDGLRAPGGACGVALVADGGLAVAKRAGTADDLRALLGARPLPAAGTGIGHLGAPDVRPLTDAAAYPQSDDAGRVAVAQDGALDDGDALRAELAGRGHRLVSGTDAEAVAHLFAEAFSSCGDPGEAMRQVCRAARGTFVLLAVHADAPDTLVAARRGLPLTVGLGGGEAFAASDGAAFGGEGAHEVLPLDGAGEDVVVLRRGADEVGCEITDAEGGVVRA